MQPSLSISIQGTTLVLGVDGHQVEASLTTSNHRQYRAQAPPIVHHSYSQSQTHRNRHSQAPLFSPRHSGTSLPPSSGHRGRDWNRKSDGGLSKAYSQGLSPSSASKALSITAPNTPVTHSWHSSSPARPKILFYHHYDPHYGFTNFSPHPVVYNGKTYPTSEHLFQSFKVSSNYTHYAYSDDTWTVWWLQTRTGRSYQDVFGETQCGVLGSETIRAWSAARLDADQYLKGIVDTPLSKRATISHARL